MSIIVYQDVATPIVPVEGLAGRIRDALGASLRSMRYPTPDFAGLYQDAAGTTPVTAVGQPVGLMLDRRFGLVRGPELVTNGALTSGTGWTDTGVATITYSAAGARIVSPVTREVLLSQSYAGAIRKPYLVEADVTMHATPAHPAMVGVNIGGLGENRFVTTPNNLQAGSQYKLRGIASLTTATSFALRIGAAFGLNYALDFTISNLTVRELPGNHASQPTTTARPALRSSPLSIDYDGVDDYLRTVFPALGSNVTIARSIPGTGAQFLTGQTINAGNWDDNVDSCAVLVIDRALTASETALVAAFLNQQAGV